MVLLFFFLTILAGLTIPLLPLSTGFVPRLGLTPLKLGHNRLVRLAQTIIVWVFASITFQLSGSVWGWVAILIALWFSIVAAKFFPERIFVALKQPERTHAGLAEFCACDGSPSRG